MPSEVIEVIRAEAARQGWTQRELAARAGLSQPAVSAILSGRRTCTAETIDRLLRAVGLSVDKIK